MAGLPGYVIRQYLKKGLCWMYVSLWEASTRRHYTSMRVSLWKSLSYLRIFHLGEIISVFWKTPQSKWTCAHLIQNDRVKLFRERHREDLSKWLETGYTSYKERLNWVICITLEKTQWEGKKISERYLMRTVWIVSDYSQFLHTKEPRGGPHELFRQQL